MSTFLNPALLLGVLGAAAPIIIHLALREKPREAPFPTLRFLKVSKRRTSKPLKLKQFILLLLRVMAVALFALALARPVARIGWLPASTTREASMVIVLDDSLSMAYQTTEGPCFERAREKALDLIDELAPTSRVAALTSGQSRGYLTRLHAKAVGVIESAEVAAHTEPVWPAVAEGYRLLKPVAGRREIHVLTDMSEPAWRGLTPEAMPAVEGVRLIVHDVGPERNENVAVQSIDLSRRALGGAFAVETAVRGGEVEGRRAVELIVNDRRRGAAEVTIEPGSVTSVELEQSGLADGGIVRGLVEAAGHDPLPIDNRHYFTVRPPETVPVAVVSPDYPGERDSLPFIVSAMLMPTREHRLVDVLTMTPEVLASTTGEELTTFRAIILLGVDELPGETARRLGTFLRRGGVLIVFAGEAPLGAPPDWSPGDDAGVARIEPDARPERLALGRQAHPLWRLFNDEELAMLGDVPFRAWRRITDIPTGAEAVATLGADPAVVHRPVGRGYVLWFASGGEPGWSGLHRHDAIFLTLLHETVRFGHRDDRPPAYRVGDAVPLEAPPAVYAEDDVYAVRFMGAAELERVPIDPVTFSGTFAGTNAPGHYAFLRLPRGDEAAAETIDVFAVNIDVEETRMTRTEPETLEELLPAGAIVGDEAARAAAEAESSTEPRELFAFAVLAVLTIATVESFLANRFYKKT